MLSEHKRTELLARATERGFPEVNLHNGTRWFQGEAQWHRLLDELVDLAPAHAQDIERQLEREEQAAAVGQKDAREREARDAWTGTGQAQAELDDQTNREVIEQAERQRALRASPEYHGQLLEQIVKLLGGS